MPNELGVGGKQCRTMLIIKSRANFFLCYCLSFLKDLYLTLLSSNHHYLKQTILKVCAITCQGVWWLLAVFMQYPQPHANCLYTGSQQTVIYGLIIVLNRRLERTTCIINVTAFEIPLNADDQTECGLLPIYLLFYFFIFFQFWIHLQQPIYFSSMVTRLRSHLNWITESTSSSAKLLEPNHQLT